MITGNKKKLIDFLIDADAEKIFELKEYEEKRTKTMNSYYWVLITKLASALETGKDELHEKIIKRYSSRDYISLLANIEPSNYFIYYDYKNTYKANNNTFKSYLVYKGSSKMNKQEFSILLNGLISECKECNIETMTPEEIVKLKYIENNIGVK